MLLSFERSLLDVGADRNSVINKKNKAIARYRQLSSAENSTNMAAVTACRRLLKTAFRFVSEVFNFKLYTETKYLLKSNNLVD